MPAPARAVPEATNRNSIASRPGRLRRSSESDGCYVSRMDFVCLAAGHGTRLGRLGTYLQKCLYPVGLKPFLEHTLDQLARSGVATPGRDRLALVVGHLEDQVRAYFGPAYEGLDIVYVTQAERRGTGHALALAAQALEPTGSVIAWQADLFVTEAMFRSIAQHPDDTVVTLGPGDEAEAAVLKATVEGDRVSRVWEGAGPLYDVGLWKLAPHVLARIDEVRAPTGEVRMLLNLQRAIDAGERVGYVETGEWIHLGGTLPSPEENVRTVVRRVLELAGGASGGG